MWLQSCDPKAQWGLTWGEEKEHSRSEGGEGAVRQDCATETPDKELQNACVAGAAKMSGTVERPGWKGWVRQAHYRLSIVRGAGGQGALLETSNLYYSEQRLIVCFNVIFKLNGYKHIPIIQNVK